MDAAQLVGLLVDLVETDAVLDDEESVGGPVLRDARLELFGDAGVLSGNEGLVVTLADGCEFQITVVQSRGAFR